jgi:hypothetical protein
VQRAELAVASKDNGRYLLLLVRFYASRRYRIGGGAKEDRTPDLLRARQALSQLSYGPFLLSSTSAARWVVGGGPGRTRTSDLTLIRGAL